MSDGTYVLRSEMIERASKRDAEINSVVKFVEEQEWKHVVGSVNSDGSKALGHGFASEKTATGKYKITLEHELETIGIIQPTVLTPEYAACRIETQGKKEFTVATFTLLGALINLPFTFTIDAS